MMPHYQCVLVSSLGYELGPVVVTTAELEERLAPAFTRLGIQPGQLEAWTGISERRWWQPNMPLSQGATAAARTRPSGSTESRAQASTSGHSLRPRLAARA